MLCAKHILSTCSSHSSCPASWHDILILRPKTLWNRWGLPFPCGLYAKTNVCFNPMFFSYWCINLDLKYDALSDTSLRGIPCCAVNFSSAEYMFFSVGDSTGTAITHRVNQSMIVIMYILSRAVTSSLFPIGSTTPIAQHANGLDFGINYRPPACRFGGYPVLWQVSHDRSYSMHAARMYSQ